MTSPSCESTHSGIGCVDRTVLNREGCITIQDDYDQLLQISRGLQDSKIKAEIQRLFSLGQIFFSEGNVEADYKCLHEIKNILAAHLLEQKIPHILIQSRYEVREQVFWHVDGKILGCKEEDEVHPGAVEGRIKTIVDSLVPPEGYLLN